MIWLWTTRIFWIVDSAFEVENMRHKATQETWPINNWVHNWFFPCYTRRLCVYFTSVVAWLVILDSSCSSLTEVFRVSLTPVRNLYPALAQPPSNARPGWNIVRANVAEMIIPPSRIIKVISSLARELLNPPLSSATRKQERISIKSVANASAA